jgi:nucleoid DNA-binding protein
MAAAKKAATKSAIFQEVAEATGKSRKDVQQFFDALTALVTKHLGKKGPGVVTVPGLFKVKVVRKPATPARPGINPFTKEAITIKAKPARNAVKAQALKALKESVQ